MPAPRQHAFGDTAIHAVHVLSFDPARETANVFVRQPENVIVLAVQPGRDIEVIFPGGMAVQKLGANKFTFLMQRFELASRQGEPGVATQIRAAYEQCMQGRAVALRAERLADRGRRDSTGKVVQPPSTAPQRDIPECDLMPVSGARSTLVERPLPPREPGERYLVVLSSSAPVSAGELEERMSTLGAVASDVALTIEAIAAGIYVGKAGTYGGSWLSW